MFKLKFGDKAGWAGRSLGSWDSLDQFWVSLGSAVCLCLLCYCLYAVWKKKKNGGKFQIEAFGREELQCLRSYALKTLIPPGSQ